jgi:quercetin dioxygenase-like cupin family protein
MQVVRIYTGNDGESHFEELDLPFEVVANAERTAGQNAGSVSFSRTQPGNFSDWHTAPRRQYVITLEGQTEIGLGDGTKRIFNPGDVLLADDLTGHGHTTAVYGNNPRVSVAIPIVD